MTPQRVLVKSPNALFFLWQGYLLARSGRSRGAASARAKISAVFAIICLRSILWMLRPQRYSTAPDTGPTRD